MASHRKSRPGAALGPGLRTPALATAALTSVAVLSQTAEAAVPADDGRPSMEEIERKIDELYRRADSAAAEDAAATRPVIRQQARVETPRQEDARRPGRRAKALEGLAPFTAAPDPAASLLAEYPEDHFAQNRVMNRLASRVKGAAERGKGTAERGRGAAGQAGAPGTPETPAAAQYDVKTAKAAVQRKLAAARELLSRAIAAPATSTSRATFATASQETARPVARPETRPVAPAAAPPVAGRGRHRVRLPAGSNATRAEQAVAFARAQIGKPYVSGASGPGSYDCAGLTLAAWKAAGVTLPRTASAQAAVGTPVPLADARAGDLVFFREDAGHVGLCTGDGMMIHAPRPGAYVCEESVHHWGDSLIHRVVRPA
ncbi:C40 family peptidase [Streptomyces bungoensis]